MRTTGIVLFLAAVMVMAAGPAKSGETSLPPLSIAVQPAGSAGGQKADRLLGDLITNYLVKNKLPNWEFVDPTGPEDLDRLKDAIGVDRSETERLTAPFEADVVIEYTGTARPVKNARVTVSARDPHLKRKLFFLEASGRSAVDDLKPKVFAGLKEHYFDLVRNGTWYRVSLHQAPRGLADLVDARLKKSCHKSERPLSGPDIYAQCKLGSQEMADLVEKVIRSRRPGAKYTIKAKTYRLVEISFQ